MIKKIIRNFVRIIQKVLIVLLLTLIYFLGFGITVIFMMVFKHKILTGSRKDDITFWVEANGYEADMEDSLRQS